MKCEVPMNQRPDVCGFCLECVEYKRFEELKESLFSWGNDYIEEFLGYSEDIEGMSRSEIEKLMDNTYEQMPNDELEVFYEKFNIK